MPATRKQRPVSKSESEAIANAAVGAVVGGIIGGPVGAVVGAATGALVEKGPSGRNPPPTTTRPVKRATTVRAATKPRRGRTAQKSR